MPMGLFEGCQGFEPLHNNFFGRFRVISSHICSFLFLILLHLIKILTLTLVAEQNSDEIVDGALDI